MRAAVLGTRFVLELCLVAALAAGGWTLAGGGALGVAAAILASLAGMAVWGAFVGPRSPRRLPDPSRLLLEALLFGLGGVALWVAWAPAAGIALAAASVVVALMTRQVGEPAPPGRE